jgi:polysaccharide biosynthesis/export protein
VRTTNGHSKELRAAESNVVKPGDTLKVEIPMPDLEDFEATDPGAPGTTALSIAPTKSRVPNVR